MSQFSPQFFKEKRPDPAKGHEASNKLSMVLEEEAYQMDIGYVNIPWAVAPRVMAWEPFPLAFYPSGMHTITLK